MAWRYSHDSHTDSPFFSQYDGVRATLARCRYYYDKFMLHYAAFRIASHPLAALAAVFWSIFLPVKLTMFLSNVNFQRLVFAETVWGFWDLGDYPANFTMTASDSMSMG